MSQNKTTIKSVSKIKKKISPHNIEMENDPDFKLINYSGLKWRIPFYKKAHVAGCLNPKNCDCFKPVRLLERHLEKNEILIHSRYKGGYYFSKINRDKFTDLISKNRSIYETLYSEYPRRLYLDIDGRDPNCLSNTKEVLYKVFPKDIKMSISGSVGIKGGQPFYSYHIILPTIVFANLQEMKDSGFTEFIKSQKNEINRLDATVYTTTQQFKTINQAKHKSDRIQKIIENDNIEEHLVQTFTQKPNAMNYKSKFSQFIKFEIKKQNLRNFKQGKKTGITGFSLKDIIPFEKGVKIPDIDFDSDSADHILHSIPNLTGSRKLGRTIMWCVMNWYFHEEGESETAFKKFQAWEKPQERNTPQSFQAWGNCITCLKWWGRIKIQHLLEAFYGRLPNKRLDKFNSEFIKGEIEGIGNTLIKTKYIGLSDLSNKKYEMMKVGMGKGKTYIVIEDLIRRVKANPDLKVCWITNRISMALNLMSRLNGGNGGDGFDLQFENYKEIGKTILGGKVKDKHKHNLIQKEVKRIVLELESLHYSAGTDYNPCGMDYDIIVIDEVESVFNSFRSDTTHGDGKFYDDNYHQFENIIQNAEKVFLMDAYLHHRSINYIKTLDPDAQINLIQADNDKIDKVVNNHQSFYSWYNNILTDIRAGKKLYIFFPFKTGKGSVQKLSIDGFKQRLLYNLGWLDHADDILVYHGDMSDVEKKALEDVNSVWQKAKVIITNSCITVGVNYEFDDFDKIYLSYADLLNPRDVIQSSFRIRKTKEQVIEFYRFPNLFKILANKRGEIFESQPLNKPNLIRPTPAFKYMMNFLLEEYNAKGHETLKKFFSETGYIKNNYWIGGDANPIEYKKFDGEGTMGCWDWENIATITKQEKEDKEQKVYANTATIDDKLQVRKWYNDVEFANKFEWEKDKWIEDRESTDSVRIEFYKKPKWLQAFKEVWKPYSIIHHVITHNKINKSYEYNDKKLNIEDKNEIENFLHIVGHGVGKNHKDKFMKMTDHIIKKKIMNYYFGQSVIRNRKDWEDRNVPEFNDQFNSLAELTSIYGNKIQVKCPSELWKKVIYELQKRHEFDEYRSQFKGCMFLDD